MTHPTNDPPARTLPTVAVCVCTCRRPEQLDDLLGRIVASAADARDVASVGVVVVDDDPAQSARDVAAAWSDRFDLGLTYASTGSGNIATPRNETLRLGVEVGSLLALIDDDCTPDVRWISELVGVQQRFGADIVSGHCIDLVPPGGPDWLLWADDDERAVADGDRVEMGYTKNVLLASEAIRRHGWTFDLAFGRTGGEDAVFFYRAADDGAEHRHAAHAIVTEPVPSDRITYHFQARRSFWYGTTEARTTIATHRASRLRVMVRGARLVARTVSSALGCLVRRRPVDAHVRFFRCLRGLGMMAGAVGVRAMHH